MKRIAVLFLIFALFLTACGAPTPAPATAAAPDQLVIVTDAPAATDEPADIDVTEPANETDEPDATEEAEPTDEAAATDEAEPTDEAAATEAPAGEATNTPSAAGDGIFTNVTRDLDAFSFKCPPSEINFTVKVTNPAVVKVTLFYRVVNKESNAAAGAMTTGKDMVNQKDGNFWLNFTALDVKEDLRLKNGWFDYQFVGFNKLGQVVGRSEKIVQQVTFTLNCP